MYPRRKTARPQERGVVASAQRGWTQRASAGWGRSQKDGRGVRSPPRGIQGAPGWSQGESAPTGGPPPSLRLTPFPPGVRRPASASRSDARGHRRLIDRGASQSTAQAGTVAGCGFPGGGNAPSPLGLGRGPAPRPQDASPQATQVPAAPRPLGRARCGRTEPRPGVAVAGGVGPEDRGLSRLALSPLVRLSPRE